MNWDSVENQKETEFPWESSHYFQLEGTLLEEKDSIHLTGDQRLAQQCPIALC